jgi:hypothetical protein
MDDYVVYHNTDENGPSGGAGGPFISSNKPNLDRVIDNRIWLISGEGTPKRYFLESCFTAARCEPGDDTRAPRVYGKDRRAPARRVPLNTFPWFKPLYEDRQLYSLGLTRLRGEKGRLLMEGLERVLSGS